MTTTAPIGAVMYVNQWRVFPMSLPRPAAIKEITSGAMPKMHPDPARIPPVFAVLFAMTKH
jgi:hypothetical protein